MATVGMEYDATTHEETEPGVTGVRFRKRTLLFIITVRGIKRPRGAP